MSVLLTRAALDAGRFPQVALDTLFAAILVDDDVDERIELPDRIMLDHDPALLVAGYRISRQLWVESGHAELLTALVARLERDGDLDEADRRTFKHVRAKLKHLRFACALFGEAHAYPPVMNAVTAAFGHLQDAFKVGDRARVARRARVCRFFLSASPRALLRREHDRLRPAGAPGFRTYVEREISALDAVIASPMLTGAAFHAARKIASRQVAFYNTLLALQPSVEVHRMSRALAAINGLMGEEHDRLVERRIAGTQDYHRDRFGLSPAIRQSIAALIARYRASGLMRAA